MLPLPPSSPRAGGRKPFTESTADPGQPTCTQRSDCRNYAISNCARASDGPGFQEPVLAHPSAPTMMMSQAGSLTSAYTERGIPETRQAALQKTTRACCPGCFQDWHDRGQ